MSGDSGSDLAARVVSRMLAAATALGSAVLAAVAGYSLPAAATLVAGCTFAAGAASWPPPAPEAEPRWAPAAKAWLARARGRLPPAMVAAKGGAAGGAAKGGAAGDGASAPLPDAQPPALPSCCPESAPILQWSKQKALPTRRLRGNSMGNVFTNTMTSPCERHYQ